MKSRELVLAATLSIVALPTGTARADHIPGHSDGDPIFPVPFPDQGDWSGNGTIVFLSLIGPDGGTTIYDTEVDITYVSDGVTSASDLVIVASLFVDGQQRELDVSGADLGFGSGPGTFTATLNTNLFNGVVDGGVPGPSSIVQLEIGSTTGPVNGTAFFVDSFLNFRVSPLGAVPTVPQWGLAALALLLLAAGVVVLRRRVLSTDSAVA